MGVYGLEWSRNADRGAGRMDAEQYCDILEQGVMESFEKLEMEEGA